MKGEHYRHNKRGSKYEVVGLASIQNATNRILREGDEMVVYRDDDGDLWTRYRGEFLDGRFAKLDEPAPMMGHTYAVRTDGGWRICKAVHALQYSLPEDKLVWSEEETTAYVCDVGDELQLMWLEGNG